MLHQVCLIRRSRAAETVHGAHMCPTVASWAFSGGFQARLNAKTGRCRNGFDRAALGEEDGTWRTAARIATADARYYVSLPPCVQPNRSQPLRPKPRPLPDPGLSPPRLEIS